MLRLTRHAVWNIAGSVIIEVVQTGTANPVISGMFFD